MTNDQVRMTVISVRADAHRSVDPDYVTVSTQLSASATDRRAASTRVGELLGRATAALAGLGGAPLTADEPRRVLSWSAHSLHTWDDWDHDEDRPVLRGYRAQVEARIVLRDLPLLARVADVLTAVDGLTIDAVQWHADDDNPAWAVVRADAIRAALLKGQDYAAALGGEVLAVEHVADAGLLGAGDGHASAGVRFGEIHAASASGGDASPSLDPEPQTLHATIDARFSASTGPLPRR